MKRIKTFYVGQLVLHGHDPATTRLVANSWGKVLSVSRKGMEGTALVNVAFLVPPYYSQLIKPEYLIPLELFELQGINYDPTK